MRKAFLASTILIFLSAILFVSSIGQPDSPRETLKPPAATAQVLAAKSLPLEFIPNAGQTNSRVSFYIKGNDRTVYFTPDGVTLALYKESKAEQPKQVKVPAGPGDMDTGPMESWVIKIDFIGAKKGVEPEGLDKTGAVFSYFKGKREDWHAGLPGYRRIVYRNLWPGIDLIYKGDVGRLKYEFIVAPGADAGLIQLGIRGASDIEVDREGLLIVKTPLESIVDEKPLVFQEGKAAERKLIAAAYHVKKTFEGEAKVGFSIADYDHSLPLVIDPVTFIYCGYIGGSGDESGQGIAVDSSGNAYVTGYTLSDQTTFPVSVGPGVYYKGDWDAFVAKVNASGTDLVYCGYIAGSYEDLSQSIAVDSSGNAYIAGATYSDQTSFPVTVGPDLTFNNNHDVYGYRDAFVAKVNASGTNLVYCGYIGGANDDLGFSLDVDVSGSAYITGYTYSDETTFPVTAGPDMSFNGATDVFVAKVNASGTNLVYCGYIGGSSHDLGWGIAVDGSGQAYITGYTLSDQTTFPVTAGPDMSFSGATDAFVAKVNALGTGLIYCGYIGGSYEDSSWGIAVDSSGSAYVTGYTYSDEATFPVLVGPDLTFNGIMRYDEWGRPMEHDAFVAKVNPSGTGLVYCGYIGGSDWDYSYGIAVDGSGNAYVTGITYSDEATFPFTVDPETSYNGGAFVAKVNASGTGLVCCAYIGDAGVSSIAVDSSGNAYITGAAGADQTTLPITTGPDLSFNGGWQDAFVAKVFPLAGGSRMADLSLAKSGDNLQPFVEDPVTFTITATNLGPRNVSGVKITDKLPDGLSFLSVDITRGTYTPASGLWTIGNLENQTSVAMTLRARVDKDGTITNSTALAGMNASDPDPLNNEASVTLMAEYRLYAPSNFQFQRLENDFIFYKEYINRLTWTANPLNRGVIVGYRLYRKPKEQPDDSFVFYREFDVSRTSFDDRGLKKNELFSYRLTSVDDKGRESDPVEPGNGGAEHERPAPGPGRHVFGPTSGRYPREDWQQRY